jgi:PLP dependent protein
VGNISTFPMSTLSQNLPPIQQAAQVAQAKLVAVTKTKPLELLQEAYHLGLRAFGENKVQEMVAKHEALPADIEWHLIGHLQTNKVKYIAPFVALIHSVDSLKLLQEINKQAAKAGRVIDVLLQIFIAKEETKFGLSEDELFALLNDPGQGQLAHVRVRGLMGMASNTEDSAQVRAEFAGLKNLFERVKQGHYSANVQCKVLSMGMSGDYAIALAEGSTLIRVGSKLFGSR